MLPQYDGVLENVSQETVYTCCGHEVVEGVLAGYNGTLMCYGQVSSACSASPGKVGVQGAGAGRRHIIM